MGAARRSRVIPDADRLITAYHEVGHALAMLLLPHADRPHKLTVVPRGRAAGYAMPMPSESEHYSKNRLLDRIGVALAGRAAEELKFGDVTTGAQNDFQQATNIARRMVAEWGMSDSLGHVALIEEQRGFLGNSMERGSYSEDTARAIDDEVKTIIETQYERVLEVLRNYSNGMERVVNVLLERETLTGEEFQTVLEGGTLPEDEFAPKRREPKGDKSEPGFIPPTVLPKPGRA
jgi:cell division protease FtsH